MSCQDQSCTWTNGHRGALEGTSLHPQWIVHFQERRKLELSVPYPSTLYWSEAYNGQTWETKQRQIEAQNRLGPHHFASQQRGIQSKAQFDSNNFVQNFNKNYVPTSQRINSAGYERMQPRQPLQWEDARQGNCHQLNLRSASTQQFAVPNYHQQPTIKSTPSSCFHCCSRHCGWNGISNMSSAYPPPPPVYQPLPNPAPVVRNTSVQTLSSLTSPLTVDTSLEYEVSHSLNVSAVNAEPLLAIAPPHQAWSAIQKRKSASSHESDRHTASPYISLQKQPNNEDKKTLKPALLQDSFTKPEVCDRKQPSAREVNNNLVVNGHAEDSNTTLQTIQAYQLHPQTKTSQPNRKRRLTKVQDIEVSAKKRQANALNNLPTSFTPPDLLSSSYKFFEAGSQDWISSGEWMKAGGPHVWNWPSTSRPPNLFVY